MTNHEKTHLSIVGSLKTIVSSRNMLVLSYLRLAFSFANAFFITFFAIHAEENLLLTSFIIASFFGVKGITNMLSRIPSGKLADKVGYKFPIIAAFALLAVAFLMISETRDISLLMVAMVIYGTAHGMRAVTEWSMLGDCAPGVAGNIATAYLSTMFNVGAALGAVVAGTLSVIFTMQTIFKLASVIVLSGVFVVNLAKIKPLVGNLQTNR